MMGRIFQWEGFKKSVQPISNSQNSLYAAILKYIKQFHPDLLSLSKPASTEDIFIKYILLYTAENIFNTVHVNSVEMYIPFITNNILFSTK